MRNYGQDAQLGQARYRASDEQAPYVPPKPKPPNPNPHETFPWGMQTSPLILMFKMST